MNITCFVIVQFKPPAIFIDLLEAAERRLTLAKLAQPRLGPAFLTWDPNTEEMVGRLIVGVALDPWPAIEDSEADWKLGRLTGNWFAMPMFGGRSQLNRSGLSEGTIAPQS